MIKTFRLGEMFCGPGGIALGAKNAIIVHKKHSYKIEHSWALDNDRDSCSTFRENICPKEPDTVICYDVRTYDLSTLPPIDSFAFGFPCNDFSIVGEKKGINGSYGPLYTYGVQVLNIFRPDWFMAENVGGLTSANEGQTFTKIIDDLRNAAGGYTLTVHLYKFEDYGIPQTRHRIIIVGIRKDLGLIYRVPAPTHESSPLSSFVAICEPPISRDVPNQEITRQSLKVTERLAHIKSGENAWNSDLPEELRLNVKGARMSQIYRRLDPSKPAYTVTGSGGGGTHMYHWCENRALTNRERARLQTFPDGFAFVGSKESVRRQIGMAVPPLAAKIIINAILKTFGGVAYPHIKPKWEVFL